MKRKRRSPSKMRQDFKRAVANGLIERMIGQAFDKMLVDSISPPEHKYKNLRREAEG